MSITGYKKVYADAFDVGPDEFCASEISGGRAVDIHHIIGRGKCGEDRIENLMALTREEHVDYGDKTDYMVFLLKIHRRHLDIREIPYENEWFEKWINYYS